MDYLTVTSGDKEKRLSYSYLSSPGSVLAQMHFNGTARMLLDTDVPDDLDIVELDGRVSISYFEDLSFFKVWGFYLGDLDVRSELERTAQYLIDRSTFESVFPRNKLSIDYHDSIGDVVRLEISKTTEEYVPAVELFESLRPDGRLFADIMLSYVEVFSAEPDLALREADLWTKYRNGFFAVAFMLQDYLKNSGFVTSLLSDPDRVRRIIGMKNKLFLGLNDR